MEFVGNTAMLALLFTCFSFCYWLSDFQAEYLGADLFVLFYAQGVIALVAGQLVILTYEPFGLKNVILIF